MAAVLNGYAKQLNKWQKAMDVFSPPLRCQFDIKPTAMHYAALIDSCGKAGEAKLAERWFGLMEKNFVDPNTVCYNVLINAHARRLFVGHPFSRRVLSTRLLSYAGFLDLV
eukprot:Skav222281  [mRNA]  locus=scaffold807:146275:154045:- [translate_table: standard]